MLRCTGSHSLVKELTLVRDRHDGWHCVRVVPVAIVRLKRGVMYRAGPGMTIAARPSNITHDHFRESLPGDGTSS